jgi:hypothetical protein
MMAMPLPDIQMSFRMGGSIVENMISNALTFQPLSDFGANRFSLHAERTSVAAINENKSLDIHILTAEGDKVSISLEARAATLYGEFQMTDLGQAGFTHQQNELSARLYNREMTFTVEGDLNPAERRDIRKALKTLDRMMHHYVNGNLKPALVQAGKLQKGNTLAGIEATMTYKQQILVAQQTEFTSVSELSTGPAIQSEATPAPSDSLLSNMAVNADTIGDALAGEVISMQTPAERMMAFVDQLLDDYRQQLSDFHELGSIMIDRVQSKLEDVLTQSDEVVQQINTV